MNKKILHYNKNADKKDRQKPKKINAKKVAVLLEGPPGSGKTTSVYAVANTRGVQVVETNASDTRNATKIKELLDISSKYTDITYFLGGKTSPDKIILVDEVDGISGNADKGGVHELVTIIKNTAHPIILTSNVWKRNLMSLYNACTRCHVKKASDTEVLKLLQRIAIKEKKQVSKSLLMGIAKNARGDFRSAINDLQMSGTSFRDIMEDVYSSIDAYFASSSSEESARVLQSSPIRLEDFYLWIFENIAPRVRRDKYTEASNVLSSMDLIWGRINSIKDWSTYPQLSEILKRAIVYMRADKSKLIQPKWFTKAKAKLYKIMKEFDASLEEARPMNLLIQELSKNKKTKELFANILK